MKNVLFMLDYYLPNASANGICVSKIIEALRTGVESVSILCLSDEEGISTEGNVTIYRVKEPKRKLSVFEPIVFYAKWFVPLRNPIPTRRALVELYVETGRKIISGDNIDTLVSVHLPIETLVATVTLQQYFPQLTIVPYMLDSMSGGHVPRFLPQRYTRWRKRRWEKRLFAHATKIVLMESAREHYVGHPISAYWSSKAVYLNVPLLNSMQHFPRSKISDSRRITLAFCGLLNYPYRNIYYIIDVVKKMETPVNLVLVGESNIANELIEISNNEDRISYKGAMPHAKVEEILEASDVLLNLGVTTPSAISGKIFEYMSYGKPIVTTCSIDNEASIPYVQRYPLGLIIDERKTVGSQAVLLDSFINNVIDKSVDHSLIVRTFFTSTPTAFCDFLTTLKAPDNEL